MTIEKKKIFGKKRPSRLVSVIIMFSITIFLFNGIIIFKRATESYETGIQEEKILLEKITNTVSDHVRLSLFAADLTLKRAAERFYLNRLFGGKLTSDIQNDFAHWAGEIPQISSILMTNESGIIQASYSKDGFMSSLKKSASVREKDFFSYHSENNQEEKLHMEFHPGWKDDHSGYITISRKLNKPGGEFGGVILVALDNDYIKDFFNSIRIDSKSSMIILNQNGDKLADYSKQINIHDYVSKSISSSDIDDKLPKRTFIENSTSFRVKNIISVEYIPSFDIFVAVGTSGDNILFKWKKDRASDLIFLSIFLLFVFVISFFATAVARQIKKARMSEKAALLASQTKSEFLANMSHELRTPLNAIIGFSEMIDTGYFGELNSKQKERVKDINFCGQHLLSLINDILEFSKGEAGKAELYEETVSIPKIVSEVIRIFTDKSKAANVRITSAGSDDMPNITADSRKIRQILLNLVSNAMKFTSENGAISISYGVNDKGDPWFAVSDTGIGMDEKDIPRALSAFGQVHEDPTKGGTGLGLPLCKMFTEMHGGNMKLESIKGVGTKITVVLPKERVVVESDE